MTFCLLLDLMGYENKIHQSGIHVNSQFWLDFSDNNGKQIPVVISVDNTFDIVSWYIPNRNKSDWLKDFGHGD